MWLASMQLHIWNPAITTPFMYLLWMTRENPRHQNAHVSYKLRLLLRMLSSNFGLEQQTKLLMPFNFQGSTDKSEGRTALYHGITTWMEVSNAKKVNNTNKKIYCNTHINFNFSPSSSENGSPVTAYHIDVFRVDDSDISIKRQLVSQNIVPVAENELIIQALEAETEYE